MSIEELYKKIDELAYNKEQVNKAKSEIDKNKDKIKKIISIFVYNREDGKELQVLTSPDIDLKIKFTY